jgi:hypothetical protein
MVCKFDVESSFSRCLVDLRRFEVGEAIGGGPLDRVQSRPLCEWSIHFQGMTDQTNQIKKHKAMVFLLGKKKDDVFTMFLKCYSSPLPLWLTSTTRTRQ